MKKIVFLLALIASFAFANTVKAQYGRAKVFPTQVGDTLNNVDSVAKFFQNTTGIASMGITVNLNKISGTIAGKVYLYGSNDPRNYSLIDSATYALAPAGSAGSVFGPLGAYTYTASINRGTSPFQYYAIVATSSGTVSAVTQFELTTQKYYPY